MNGDPLYQKIITGLAGISDGQLFQQCANALLGQVHPNLAPMSGGNDGGFDGSFGTDDGRYPLVCTIQDDVIGNFRNNISTYLSGGGTVRRAVIATSRLLTNAKKQNLADEARKLNIDLVNIYDGLYFANELYRDRKWRRELLGIGGDVSALSKIPRQNRTTSTGILIGREPDLRWLSEAHGDVLLVGQPGSGKTYLHQILAGRGNCLFAVDGHLERLADALREQQPSIVVVDDALVFKSIVESLVYLRNLGTYFHIHLNCWPNQERSVCRLLDIEPSRVRRLARLKRSQIYDLVCHHGIHGPEWLQHLLIEQSDGNPGLATALSTACRNENVGSVWNGDVAAREILGDLRLIRRERDKCVLASFALGGDEGMSFKAVAAALAVVPMELKEIVAALGEGGLVEDLDGERLRVRPPVIRPVLVREVFYAGAASHPIEMLLQQVPAPSEALTVLLSARQRGAEVPQRMLRTMLVHANDSAWEHYAWVDSDCADDVITSYPNKIPAAAPGLLHHHPEQALHALMDLDEASVIHSEGLVEHPRRRISEWMFPIDRPSAVTIANRAMLLSVLEERVGQNMGGDSLAWALGEILRIKFDTARSSPRSEREFRVVRGIASPEVIEQTAKLWQRILMLLPQINLRSAKAFLTQLECWCLPQRLTTVADLPQDVLAAVKSHGCAMLSDILELPQCNRAWRNWAAGLVDWGGLDLSVPTDPLFVAIFGDIKPFSDWHEQEAQRAETLSAIADTMSKSKPAEVVQHFEELRKEAAEFDTRKQFGRMRLLYELLSRCCDDPLEWIDQLVAFNAPSDYVWAFLHKAQLRSLPHVQTILQELIAEPSYRTLAVNQILRNPTPEPLLTQALEVLPQCDLSDAFWLVSDTIPVDTMLRLLKHSDPNVRASAACSEWQLRADGAIRSGLEKEWRQAICEIDGSHHSLAEICKQHPDLGARWVERQLKSNSRFLSSNDDTFAAVADVLTREDRRRLLRLLTTSNCGYECVDMLLGDHVGLYAEWLDYQESDHLRWMPLSRWPDGKWFQMATLALNAGMSPDDLAEYSRPRCWDAAECLAARKDYERLAVHKDVRFRPAGVQGLKFCEKYIKEDEELRDSE